MNLTRQVFAAFKLVVTIGVTTLLLSACGFKLRGVDSANLEHQLVFLESETPFGELESQLKRNLKNSGAKLTTDFQLANFQLKLVELDMTSQGASRDATGRANEIILRAKLTYQLAINHPVNKPAAPSLVSRDNENRVQESPLKTIKVSRSFYQNYRNPVSEQTLRKQTQREIIDEVVRRLTMQMQWQAQLTVQQSEQKQPASY